MEANDSGEARRLGLTDWEGAELTARPGTASGGSPSRKLSTVSGERAISYGPVRRHTVVTSGDRFFSQSTNEEMSKRALYFK